LIAYYIEFQANLPTVSLATVPSPGAASLVCTKQNAPDFAGGVPKETNR
jgi:hypothetical protein